MPKSGALILLAVASVFPCASAFTAEGAGTTEGVRGGLVVWIGCDRIDEVIDIGKSERYLVQILDDDVASVRRARQSLRDAGVDHRAWVSRFDGRTLPFADNVVNLVVAGPGNRVSERELLRVLVPRGVALAGGRRIVKPVPSNIDEWTHHLHDASCNAVAKDSVVGPPARMQWAAEPLWSKHHHATANVNAMVSAQGRVFTVCDESPVSIDPAIMPDDWNLVARDAFNGVLLWRIPIELWGTRAWNAAHPHGRNNQPTHIGRRLVAVGDRVYVTLGYNSPVSELDAAAGEVLRVFAGTKYTDAILCQNGKLILVINKGAQAAAKGKPPVHKQVAVLDLKTGRMVWRVGDYVGLQSKTGDMNRINHLTVAAGRDRLFFFGSQKELVCLSLATGKQLWRAARPVSKVHEMRYNLRVTDRCTLVAHDGILLLAQPEPTKKFGHKKGIAKIYAFDVKTGKQIWDRPMAEWGWAEPPDVFVVNNELWVFDLKTFSLMAIDPRTGRELRRWSTAKALDKGHHHRCYRNRSAERYVITSHRGIELFDLKTGEISMNPFVRGACQFGYLPCNGLLYSTPHPCACFIDGKLNGMRALAPAGKDSAPPTAPRLVKGSAWGASSVKTVADPEAWPTYRHDAQRSGSTTTRVPASLKKIWSAEIAGVPTACVVGEGVVLVASRSTRRLYAFDEDTGAAVWDRVLDGEIDSPPTIFRGTALFGTRDGWVNCLRLTDGEMVWRLKAAPSDRWLHVYDRIESASPVFGSVVVIDGTAYVTAGRSSYLDGGIFAYALDPATGAVKQKKTLFTKNETKVACLSDILVSSGDSVFMRNRAVFGPTKATRNFVFSRSGLLDEAWFNRAAWSVGRETKGSSYGFWSSGGGGQAMHPLSGQYMVHDDDVAYGVVAASANRDRGIFLPGRKGYRLNCATMDLKKNAKPKWSVQVKTRIMAMVNTPDVLFAAGTPDVVDQRDPWAAIEGRKGGQLLVISKVDGSTIKSAPLEAPPVLDGLACAHGRLFVVLKNGRVVCMGGN